MADNLPAPRPGENQQPFVARCVTDQRTVERADDPNRRLDLCRQQWQEAVDLDRVRANAELGRDPTQTVTLRRDYAVAASKRLRAIKSGIYRGIGKADVFGLRRHTLRALQEDPEVRRRLNRLRTLIRRAVSAGNWDRARELAVSFVNTPGRFDFPSDANKLDAFMGWLDETADAGVLEILRGPQRDIVSRSEWQDVYVRRSYRKGLRDAGTKLGRTDITLDEPQAARLSQVMNRPIHAEKLSSLFSRNFRELQGITEAMGQTISRELSEGLAQGLNPLDIANRLNGRVDAIGIQRARTMARTEVIRSHAEATLNRFQEAGVREVRARVEFATAGDARVCAICEALELEGRFPLEKARGLIPVHPNCRCTWFPITQFSDQVSANVGYGSRPYILALQRRHTPAWLLEAAA